MDFAASITRFRKDPTLFVTNILNADPDEWQSEVMAAVARGDRGISIRSGHGVGKTSCLSWLALWWISCHYHAKVVITAPTSAQLHDALLPEAKAWLKQSPDGFADMFTVRADRIELAADPERNFISARTSRAEQPDALQGVHAEHVLLICDEASGVPESVYEAAGGSMSALHASMVLAGNPVRSSGYFYDTFHKLSDRWTNFHVSCEKTARVSNEYIEECRLRYGEESNTYRVRVLGDFPKGDDDTVISMELTDGAINRDVIPTQYSSIVWGVDVARFGTDASALCRRKGNAVTEPVRLWRGLDTMQLTGAIKAEYDTATEKPEEIFVDAIGLGAGVADRLRELGLPAYAINVSESPAMGDTYLNLRAELWYKAKAWLEGRDVRLPRDDRLKSELTTLRYNYTSSGKVKIESKADLKKRGVASPDAADAFVLTFASDAGTAMGGRSRRRHGKLKRDLAGIV
jgi:phage terminase large subunit|tara:strand:+ start:1177 stop:2562 length:1386 start_codon:yes stop_codon:yes gene_type:complete